MCQSVSLSHKLVERSTGSSFPPIFTKLATKEESQEMWSLIVFNEIRNIHVRQTGSGIKFLPLSLWKNSCNVKYLENGKSYNVGQKRNLIGNQQWAFDWHYELWPRHVNSVVSIGFYHLKDWSFHVMVIVGRWSVLKLMKISVQYCIMLSANAGQNFVPATVMFWIRVIHCNFVGKEVFTNRTYNAWNSVIGGNMFIPWTMHEVKVRNLEAWKSVQDTTNRAQSQWESTGSCTRRKNHLDVTETEIEWNYQDVTCLLNLLCEPNRQDLSPVDYAMLWNNIIMPVGIMFAA